MKNRLVRLLVHINAHIVSVQMVSPVHLLLHGLKHHIHGLPFMIGQVKVRSHMPLGDNQYMAWRYRITVIECHTGSRLTNNFHSPRQTAERTNLPFVIINSCLIVRLFYILKNLSSFFELLLFYRLTYNFFLLDKKQKELSI